MRLSVSGVLLAGCLARPHAAPPGDGAGSQGRDGAVIPCTVVLSDDFAGSTPPCGATWGTAIGAMYLVRSGGVLHAAPDNLMSAGCVTAMMLSSREVDLQVVQPLLLSSDDRTYFQVNAASGNSLAVSFSSGSPASVDAVYDLTGTFSHATYDPVSMQWWRFVVQASNVIAIDYAPDGAAWVPWTTKSFGSDPTDKLSISFYATANPGHIADEAQFDNLRVCQ
jgi:hypothetical protein